MNLHRIISFISALALSVSLALAQSSGDKLYNQGLQLQKTMTYSAQNQAIAKFRSAKKLYDSAAKKSQCDQAIAVSQNIIKNLGPGSNSGNYNKKKDKNDIHQSQVDPALEISPADFSLSDNHQSIQVKVATNQKDWSVSPVNDGSELFATAHINGNNINIDIKQNFTYEKRIQKFLVTTKGIIKEITITQSGKYAQLNVSEGVLNFKPSGNKKKVEVSCNSTQKYLENANENWYVASKPDWIVITINQKRKAGLFDKLKDKTKEIVGGGEKEDVAIKKTSITIQAKPILSKQSAQEGRQGEIVIKSGDSTVTIYVSQSDN